jgi:hypothetical protein
MYLSFSAMIWIHKSTKLHVLMSIRVFQIILGIQQDSQPNHQTVKLKTAAFSAQQLSLHSWTASHSQPKQTGPKLIRRYWWGAEKGKRKTHWIGWDSMLRPKSQGG